MNIVKASFYPLVLEVIKWIIVSSFWFLGLGGTDKWIQNTVYTIGLGLSSMIVYLLFYFILKIRKPLKIKISMENIVSGKSTNFYAGNKKSREAERTIKMTLSIQKQSSIFSWFGLKLLKNKHCVVSFDTLPEAEFTLEPGVGRIIKKKDYGFDIILDASIRQLLEAQEGEVKRTIEFIIIEGKDSDISNMVECEIKPRYLINGRELGIFHSFTYDVLIESHKICYYGNYMGLK